MRNTRPRSTLHAMAEADGEPNPKTPRRRPLKRKFSFRVRQSNHLGIEESNAPAYSYKNKAGYNSKQGDSGITNELELVESKGKAGEEVDDDENDNVIETPRKRPRKQPARSGPKKRPNRSNAHSPRNRNAAFGSLGNIDERSVGDDHCVDNEEFDQEDEVEDFSSLDEEPAHDLAQSVFLKVFRELDTDDSGKLSRREVRAALSRLGLPTTPEFLEPMFSEFNIDRDGVISFDEFMEYAVRREQELRRVFDDLDSNCDGIIDETDIRAGLRKLGLRASNEKITSLIQKMDQTNDGIITFAEFQAFLMLLPNQTLDEMFQTWAKSSRIDLGENMQVPDELSGSAGDALITFAAGAAAGAVSRTATAPMDRLKVLLQAGPTGGSFTVRTASSPDSTILGGLRAIYGEGGLWAFFRGNGTNVLKIMPESAFKFFAYDWFKRHIAKDVDNIQVYERFISGAFAGVTSQTLIYPLEIVKTRLAVARRGEYRGITHCMLKTVETNGARGLFAGLGASCTGIVPYAGIDLCVFMTLKQQWLNAHPDLDEEGPDAITLLGMGAFSSTCGQVVAYPLQLVRTKLQAQVRVSPACWC